MSTTRIKRYHKDIFYPEWTENVLRGFKDGVRQTFPLVLSVHAVDKIISYVQEYGSILWKDLLKIIRSSPLDGGEIFEFYWNTDMEKVTKVCIRYSEDNLPVDLIVVISLDSTIITLYVTNKGDTHQSMNKNLYVRKEKSSVK